MKISKLPFVLCSAMICSHGLAVDPCDQVELASIPAEGFTRHVELVGDQLFVLEGAVLTLEEAGLRVFDVSDPASPVFLGQVATPGLPTDIALSGQTAFIADGGVGGLQIINIADPESPFIVGSLETPGLAAAITVLDSTGVDIRLAVADGASGVQIIDVNEKTPELVFTINTDGLANDVLGVGTSLFVADGWNGVTVYEFTSPTSAIERARVTLSSSAQKLRFDANRNILYVAQATGGIAILDVNDPSMPALISEYQTPGAARAIAVSSDFVYVADSYDGLLTLDTSAPPLSGIIEYRELPGAAVSVALRASDAGSVAFVAANQAGVQILNLQMCETRCPADFAQPFGVLDLVDVSTFVSAIQNQFGDPLLRSRAESLAPPEDLADLADIVAFLESFLAGCP